MRNGNHHKLSIRQGFTLVELLVVLAIVALLLTIATPRYFANLERAKESTLHQDLTAMREAIDKYYGDNGRYPESLVQLVERKYINKIPVDPITEKNSTWLLIKDDTALAGVEDVRSGAQGTAKDGSRYAEW
ncbi:MAG: prepilin-type N-terminal cleavage/methylation domain-containing protein [Methylophilaceae bacterium]